MVIGPTQALVIAMFITGAIGFARGWGKEVITCAVILATVLFLSNGGDDLLTRIWVGFPEWLNALLHPRYVDPPPDYTWVTKQSVSMVAFVGMSWLGYSAGKKFGSGPKQANHRIAGIIPGAINGLAMAYYVSHNLFNGNGVTVYGPDGSMTAARLPIYLWLALVTLLGLVLVVHQASKSH